MLKKLLLSAAIGVTSWSAAQAADYALLVGTEDYRNFEDVDDGRDVLSAQSRFEDAGFEVTVIDTPIAAAAGEAVSAIARQAETGRDRFVVVLSGRFASDGAGQIWYLSSNSGDPGYFTMPRAAFSLQSLFNYLEEFAGRSIVFLATDDRDEPINSYLNEGIEELDIPSGVTVVMGSPEDVTRGLQGALLERGTNLAAALPRQPGLTVEGYMPDRFIFLPRQQAGAPYIDWGYERRMWQAAVAQNTAQAYRSYLYQNPNGMFRSEAQRRLAILAADPYQAQRAGEEALRLSRVERQQIQEDLVILEYNTGGIDGIMGTQTRQAIRNWQQQNGLMQSTFLDAPQIALLHEQADRSRAQRAAEEARLDRLLWRRVVAADTEAAYATYLQERPNGAFAAQATTSLERLKAERLAAEAEARDREAWAQADGARTQRSYQRYLDRFPEGLFAAIAIYQLNELRQERQAEADRAAAEKAAEEAAAAAELRAQDAAAWQEARKTNTVRGYRAYLDVYPQGRFAERAKNRLDALRAVNQQQQAQNDQNSNDPMVDVPLPTAANPESLPRERIEELRAVERSFNLNDTQKRQVEWFLLTNGYLPRDAYDGEFGPATRRAIADYRRETDRPVHGFLNRPLLRSMFTDRYERFFPQL